MVVYMMGVRATLAAGLCLLGTVLSVMAAGPAAAQTPLGSEIENVARVFWEQDGTPFNIPTNTVEFQVVAVPTPSTIEFFRHAPVSPGALIVPLNGSDYLPGGSGDFVPVGPPTTLGGATIDITAPVPVAPADSYVSGELMIIRVTDAGQNGDPGRIETLIITITTSGGDQITLRLHESGPDTGEFWAWVPSSREATSPDDAVLTAPNQTELTATYVDRFDATEVSIDTALVDPFGRVFDSLTGDLIDGATVTLVEAATGQPAAVFGIDGVASYPASIVSGGTVTDEAGRVYDLGPGEFLFPFVAPGRYRVEIAPPADYIFPSSYGAEAFADLKNAPFTIIAGSYGEGFQIAGDRPLEFDIPLDTASEVVVSKEVDRPEAAIGDFVSYTVQVLNRNDSAVRLRLLDALPRGFRYQEGSLRIDGERAGEPETDADGRTLLISGGILQPGEGASVRYIAAIGAGATVDRDNINVVHAVNGGRYPISNRAEAAVRVRQDLFSTRVTIIGRVVEDACDGDEDWARDLGEGRAVAGVRLYLETGDVVITDEDGLYHFEGVMPGTHVVQVDQATLPEGLVPMVCEENTRYAHSPTSKFVDAQGGMIWRANFYLTREPALRSRAADGQAGEGADISAPGLAPQRFNQNWLTGQDAAPAWVYPEPGSAPSSRSVNFGIKAPVRSRIKVTVNGRAVSNLHAQKRITSGDDRVELFRWRGVDIQPGENVFEARVYAPDGTVTVIEERFWLVDAAQKASLVDDQSVLVADGRNHPVIAVRLQDGEGHPVHAGRVVEVELNAPYRLKARQRFEGEAPVSAGVRTPVGLSVGEDGVLRVELEPTLETGQVRIRVPLAGNRHEDIAAYLRPERRDWIVVGLAEGELRLDGLSPDGAETDGRLALFAKGMVKGDWLMTVAVDTAKRRGLEDDILFEEIDPNAFYTLYGDRTYQDNDAESRYPFYVKLEKDTFQALFGDFYTDLNDSDLARYARRLSGVKTVYSGSNLSASGFAAETNQGFVKDEIAADGTSGPYYLSRAPVVRQSETITLETRDRLRPDITTSTRTLTRYADYEIDYSTGELIFRFPVDAVDTRFGETVIIADYEVSEAVERNVTFGGRAAVHTADRRLEAGVSFIQEEGNERVEDATSRLAGLDLRARLTETVDVRAEIARSEREEPETGETTEADAYLAEVIHQSDALTLGAYIREEQDSFGLGQQGTGTSGLRRLGARAEARISQSLDAQTGLRGDRLVTADAYREERLRTGAVRDVAEASIVEERPLLSGRLGLRSVSEDIPQRDEARDTVQVFAAASKTFAEQGITLSASHEQPVSGSSEVSLFPQRTVLGADKLFAERARLSLRHEMSEGVNASGDTTTALVTVTPWTGGQLSLGADMLTGDSARRIGATVGVDQTIRLDERWSLDGGAARRANIEGGDDPLDPLADAAVSPLADGLRSPLTLDESFTSLYTGLAYRGEHAAGSGRLEMRDSVLGTRWTALVGGAREATETLSYAAAVRWQGDNLADAADLRALDARIGIALRPRDDGLVVLNRFDMRFDERVAETRTLKLVNNLGVNARLSDAMQASVFHGVKWTQTEAGDLDLSGWTHLLGGELRHDITRRFDIGVHGSVLATTATDTLEYSFGPSVGFTPVDDVWISLGYNLVGFVDRDFEAADRSLEGLFMKLRFKFDERTLEGLLRRISPDGA